MNKFLLLAVCAMGQLNCERQIALIQETCLNTNKNQEKCLKSFAYVFERCNQQMYKLKYMASSKKKTWSDAQKICEKYDGNLASILSESELNSIKKTVQIKQNKAQIRTYWIGATDQKTEGIWTWSDGRDFQFSDWSKNMNRHYANDCAVFVSNINNRSWQDQNCDKKNRFICKVKVLMVEEPMVKELMVMEPMIEEPIVEDPFSEVNQLLMLDVPDLPPPLKLNSTNEPTTINEFTINEPITIKEPTTINDTPIINKVPVINATQHITISAPPHHKKHDGPCKYELALKQVESRRQDIIDTSQSKKTDEVEIIAIWKSLDDKNKQYVYMVAITTAAVILVLIILCFCCCCSYCKNNDKTGQNIIMTVNEDPIVFTPEADEMA